MLASEKSSCTQPIERSLPFWMHPVETVGNLQWSRMVHSGRRRTTLHGAWVLVGRWQKSRQGAVSLWLAEDWEDLFYYKGSRENTAVVSFGLIATCVDPRCRPRHFESKMSPKWRKGPDPWVKMIQSHDTASVGVLRVWRAPVGRSWSLGIA